MQRKAWFEIHDHPWFPGFLRDLVTEALEAMWNAQDFYGPVAARLRRALDESGATRVVDLCSGGGGPWLRFSRHLAGEDGSAPAVLLTDKYPNQRAFQQIQEATGRVVGFYPEPVDAMRIPPELAGFRTMFSTFHHFGPADARAILKDAFDQRQGIAVFEAAKCDCRTLAAVFVVPLLALRLAPRIRPFRWGRIFWTYCLPVIPFTVWLDGLLSCLRSYSTGGYAGAGRRPDRRELRLGDRRRAPGPGFSPLSGGLPCRPRGNSRRGLEQMERPAQQTPSGPVSGGYATAEVAFRR